MELAIFTLTFSVTLLYSVVWIGYLFNQRLELPYYKQLDIRSWWILYPSVLYQVYFWADLLLTDITKW